LQQLKKYHPFGNLKLNNLGIVQSIKLLILVEKILRISLKLNFIPKLLAVMGSDAWVGNCAF